MTGHFAVGPDLEPGVWSLANLALLYDDRSCLRAGCTVLTSSMISRTL